MKEFIIRVIDPEEIKWYEEEPEIPELVRCKDCKYCEAMDRPELDLDKLQRTIKICAKFPERDCKGCEYSDGFWCFHDELMEDIDKAIGTLKERQWNFLHEDSDGIVHGLPGDDGQYLMTDGKEIWIDDYMDGVEDGIFLDSGRDIREIKAWMEMPELPEESA